MTLTTASQADILDRIFALPAAVRETCAELIGPGKRTVEELATRYGVSTVTIYSRWRRARTQYGLPLPPLGPGGRKAAA